MWLRIQTSDRTDVDNRSVSAFDHFGNRHTNQPHRHFDIDFDDLVEHFIWLIDFLRASLWLVALVVIFVPLERLFAARPQKVLWKGIAVDLGYYFLSSLLPAIMLSAPIGLLAWVIRSFVPPAIHETTAGWPFWARVLAGEIGYYWGHRWCHEVPALWQFHSIHHSAEEGDFLVNTGAHPIDFVFGRFCSLVPIDVLGLGGPYGGAAGSQVPIVVILIGTRCTPNC